jgi:hypothetical protein
MAELQAIAGTSAKWEQVWPAFVVIRLRGLVRPLDSHGAACVPTPKMKLKPLFQKEIFLLLSERSERTCKAQALQL